MQGLGDNLLRYNLDKTKFLVVDFETESLSLTHAKPWEIGWSVYHGKNEIEKYQYYLNWPKLEVSKGAAQKTNFDIQNIKKYGKNPKEIIDLFNKYLYNPDYKIIGANLLGFDVYIHNTSQLELGYKTDYSYINRIYDTVALSRAYKLNIKIPEKKDDYLPFQYRLLNIKQKGMKTSNSLMAKEFGVEINESKLHTVSYDIGLAMGVFLNLINKLEIE